MLIALCCQGHASDVASQSNIYTMHVEVIQQLLEDIQQQLDGIQQLVEDIQQLSQAKFI